MDSGTGAGGRGKRGRKRGNGWGSRKRNSTSSKDTSYLEDVPPTSGGGRTRSHPLSVENRPRVSALQILSKESNKRKTRSSSPSPPQSDKKLHPKSQPPPAPAKLKRLQKQPVEIQESPKNSRGNGRGRRGGSCNSGRAVTRRGAVIQIPPKPVYSLDMPDLSQLSSSVAGTSSHHADKNTQKNKSRNWQKGRVVPFKGILVNQGLKKIKLEEDFIPIKVEANVATEASSEDRDGDDMFTEEFTVIKEEVNSSVVLPEEQSQEDLGSSSSYSCREEVEALKKAVKQLTLQVKKQNEVITKIKSSLQKAGISVTTCCQYDEEEDEANRDEDGAGQSAVIDVTSEPTSRSVSEEPLVTQNDVSQECIAICREKTIPQDNLEGSVSKVSVAKCSDVPRVFSNKSFASLGTLTSEAGPHNLGKNTEHAEMDADMQSDNESSLRNAAVSVTTCCQDDDEENEASRDGNGGGESAVIDEPSEPTSKSVPKDPLLIQNAESQECIDVTQGRIDSPTKQQWQNRISSIFERTFSFASEPRRKSAVYSSSEKSTAFTQDEVVRTRAEIFQ